MKINSSDRPPSSKWRKKKKQFHGPQCVSKANHVFQTTTTKANSQPCSHIYINGHILGRNCVVVGFFFHYTPCLIIRFSFTAYLAHLASLTFKNRYNLAQFITRNAFHSRTVANL